MDATTVIELPASLDVRTVSELHRQLMDERLHDADVRFETGALTSIDTAGLQLLAVFARGTRERGRSVTWSGSADVLERGARRLGLTNVLGIGDAKDRERN